MVAILCMAAAIPYLPMVPVLGTLIVVALIPVVIAWPNAATLLLVFALYTNAAVIAVRFHGLPLYVGASLPVLLIPPLIYYLVVRADRLVLTPVLPLVVLFWLVQMVSMLFSGQPEVSTSIVMISAVEGVALYFLLTNVVRDTRMVRRVVWTLLAAGAFLGCLSLHQQLTKSYERPYGGFAQASRTAFKTGTREQYTESTQRRLGGPLGEKNRYAQVMLMLVPLGLMRMWGERRGWARLLAAGATACIMLGMALAFSRGAAVAFVIMLLVMLVTRCATWRQCGVLVAAGIMALMMFPAYGARMTSLERLHGAATGGGREALIRADGAMRSRFTEAAAAGMMFLDHPLTGVGPGMYPVYYAQYAKKVGMAVKNRPRQPHNLYLGVAAELGLPGLLSLLAVLFMTLYYLVLARARCAVVRPELANLASALMLALVAYMASGLFLHFAFIRYFWLFMALAGATSHVALAESREARRVAATAVDKQRVTFVSATP